MTRLDSLLSHLTAILSMMFLVFLILDQFNPLMNFVDNSISHWLLCALCFCAITRSVLCWTKWKRKNRA